VNSHLMAPRHHCIHPSLMRGGWSKTRALES
jgi:hypothetical protein